MAINKLRHLGIIMDGNRRWAKKHRLQAVIKGHEAGADTMFNLAEWCVLCGIEYLSVYAFSTENWNRSQDEVSGLFDLMENAFARQICRCEENGIRIRIIGNHSLLSERAKAIIEDTQNRTAAGRRLTMQVALSYGGRDEIVRSVQKLAQKAASGQILPKDIDEEMLQDHLDTAGVPDIDLVVRTGGQKRLSNFFAWQTVYSELYFIDTLWPDFSQEDLKNAMDYFEKVQVNKGK